MNPRLRLAFLALAILCAANIAWRVWEGWGRITIRANDTPVADVVRSIEKQAGIKLRSNLPADAKVTMQVIKASLPHALEVLATNTESSWSVAYLTAPDKGSIETALTSLSSGGRNVEGWTRFGFRGGRMGGMGDEFGGGVSDPRTDSWQPKPAEQATLHGYLEQASFATSAQFWAPENWNPAVTAPPKADEIRDVMPKLAKAARGQVAEVFLLRGRQQGREFAEGGEREERPFTGDGERRRDRMPSDAMRQAMEDRARAQIDKLPKDQRAAALAELEERRKFFAELSQLSPEERRAKFQERMEQAMNNSEMAERMENGSTRRGAMQTAEGRAERYRSYLDRKRQSSN